MVKQCTKCGVFQPLENFYLKQGKPRARCKACWAEQAAAKYKGNREAMLAQQKEYAAAHKDEVRAKSARHYQANRAVRREQMRAWAATNPERWRDLRRTHDMASRARQAGCEVEVVRYSEIVARDGMVCGICGGQVEPGDLSLDHIVPIKQKGPHRADNLRVAHLSCNQSRPRKVAS